MEYISLGSRKMEHPKELKDTKVHIKLEEASGHGYEYEIKMEKKCRITDNDMKGDFEGAEINSQRVQFEPKIEDSSEENVLSGLLKTECLDNHCQTNVDMKSEATWVDEYEYQIKIEKSDSTELDFDLSAIKREEEILNLENDNDESFNGTTNSLPEISKKRYETVYKLFMDWQRDKETPTHSENVLFAYFSELSKKYKSSTLWTQYSMLRVTINIHHNVDIAKYGKLRTLLKLHSNGYRPKKSKCFSTEEINKFITEAPDQQYLLTKTALIMGVMGACSRVELHQIKITHLKDLGSAVLVTVPNKKKKSVRTFTVPSCFYGIIKKYWNLRPSNANDDSFFLNYQKGKCTVQKVGINKFGAMGKQIATYLQLPNPALYTGHCFRRSPAIIPIGDGDDGVYITSSKRHGSRKSSTLLASYDNKSVKNELNIACDDSELKPTLQNFVEDSNANASNLLPKISKKKYETAYQLFMDWQRTKGTSSFSDNVLMAYFTVLSEKYKSSSLWTHYSMLRMTLSIHHNIDIAKYGKLRTFLKQKSSGYRPKKSKCFSADDIKKFITEAPDQQYLLTKTALIMGVMGACSRLELHQMKITHLTDLDSAVLVTVPDTRRKTVRTFTVSSYYYSIIKKYWNLRPSKVGDASFFLNYQKGKCTVQKVGINKFGAMGKQVARYLQLPNPDLYTGHCFRRSPSTIGIDEGVYITSSKSHGDRKSPTVLESHDIKSLKNEPNIARDTDSELKRTLTNIEEDSYASTSILLPENSKKRYEAAYKSFMDWQRDKGTSSCSENVLIAYFTELSEKYKSSSLWTQYFMLRITLNIHHNVDIAMCGKLRTFLKQKASGYRPKKSKSFSAEDINKFITEAPDQQYLLTKTALIMGVMGACSRVELHEMKITHLKDLGSAILVTFPDKRRKTVRTFTVSSPYNKIIRKYWNLRPSNANDSSFFLNYQKGKCTVQKVGINKFGAMGKQIARYLQLPNADLYTGHCFRRSPATIRIDDGVYITSSKRHGNRKSLRVLDSCDNSSLINELNIVSDSDIELKPTHQNIVEDSSASTSGLLPKISKKKYETAYQLFMDWQRTKGTSCYSENILMDYFTELSEKYKSSSLSTHYSMLRINLTIHHNVDIAKYGKLRIFLKRMSLGYKPKESKTFSTEEINEFITKAPDQQYLLIKTALIMGVMGACSRHELHQMKITHLTDLGSAMLVTVPEMKRKTVRAFTLSSYYYKVIKKYWDLRPSKVDDASFFLNYQKGKCTVQRVGINKFGAMGKQIATYLQLPNPELYTGHCFRKSSASFRVELEDADI